VMDQVKRRTGSRKTEREICIEIGGGPTGWGFTAVHGGIRTFAIKSKADKGLHAKRKRRKIQKQLLRFNNEPTTGAERWGGSSKRVHCFFLSSTS